MLTRDNPVLLPYTPDVDPDFAKLVAPDATETRTAFLVEREDFSYRNRAVTDHFDDLHLNVVKNEQYTRRDTVTVIGDVSINFPLVMSAVLEDLSKEGILRDGR